MGGSRREYWSAIDAGTGNRWERKCAESREQLCQRRLEPLGWNRHMTAGEKMRRNVKTRRKKSDREREGGKKRYEFRPREKWKVDGGESDKQVR